MTLVEEYYELNEAEEVSAAWKGLHIGFYASAACLGLWCGYTMANVRTKFDERCYLFSEVSDSQLKGGKADHSSINWESDTLCDYYQFSMVFSFIAGMIWATFFLMCGKGGKSLTGLPQPWRIVWPSLIFNFIFFLIALSTAIQIQQGTIRFCSITDKNGSVYSKALVDNCELLQLLLTHDSQVTALQLEIVIKASWGCAISWLILLLLSFFRIVFVVDFHIYKICVFKIDDAIQNKKEEVLRITNYEEQNRKYLETDEGKRVRHSDSSTVFENLEEGNRKKGKIDRKSLRQYFKAANPSLQPNVAFYVAADIRMLNRENKTKKSSKVLDDAFKNKTSGLGVELRKTIKIQSKLDVSEPSEMPKFLSKYSERFHDEENSADITSLSSTIQKPHRSFSTVGNESRLHNETFVSDFEANGSLTLKKLI